MAVQRTAQREYSTGDVPESVRGSPPQGTGRARANSQNVPISRYFPQSPKNTLILAQRLCGKSKMGENGREHGPWVQF